MTRHIAAALVGTTILISASTAVADEAVPDETVARVPWREPSGRGVAIGYENGLWGSLFVQGLRVRIPFVEHWGLVAKGVFLHDNTTGDEYRGDTGGRLDLYGSSSVIANFVRLYGGGGPHVTHVVTGPGTKQVLVGGGGHFGFEFFQSARFSWILEVGGGSGVDGRGTGATAVAGLQVYPRW